jgi:hypothetical protein
MCNHPEVLEADAKAAAEFGMFYPMGARAMSEKLNSICNWKENWQISLRKNLLIF